MESIADTIWDVVLCGTSLQQSLLALALSRTDKKILHIDPNEYYGGSEACLNLQDAETWAASHSTGLEDNGRTPLIEFGSACVTKPEPRLERKEDTGSAKIQQSAASSLAASRSYALALAPQLLHARSRLVNELVSSQAYRQLEFLAVSSFFILEPSSSAPLTLIRIPATREDVFASNAMPARSKRKLMKFLKFVLSYRGAQGDGDGSGSEGEKNASTDEEMYVVSHAAEPFGPYLESAFGLDGRLRDYILALTMSLDGARVTVADGLARLQRHITSMGAFGPGFAAVYPKWGGCSEIVQVACRNGAVGGAVYMLGAGIRALHQPPSEEASEATTTAPKDVTESARLIEVELTTNERVKTRLVICGNETAPTVTATSAPDMLPPMVKAPLDTERQQQKVSRLVAIIGSSLAMLFAPTVEGAPVAGGAVIAIPAGQPILPDGTAFENPVFVIAHSSETAECPRGQSVLYLATIYTPEAKNMLEKALALILDAISASSGGSSSGGNSVDVLATSTASTQPVPPSPPPPNCLYQLYYEQQRQGSALGCEAQDGLLRFQPPVIDLTVEDASLDAVRDAWAQVTQLDKGIGDGGGGNGGDNGSLYMNFADREDSMADDE